MEVLKAGLIKRKKIKAWMTVYILFLFGSIFKILICGSINIENPTRRLILILVMTKNAA